MEPVTIAVATVLLVGIAYAAAFQVLVSVFFPEGTYEREAVREIQEGLLEGQGRVADAIAPGDDVQVAAATHLRGYYQNLYHLPPLPDDLREGRVEEVTQTQVVLGLEDGPISVARELCCRKREGNRLCLREGFTVPLTGYLADTLLTSHPLAELSTRAKHFAFDSRFLGATALPLLPLVIVSGLVDALGRDRLPDGVWGVVACLVCTFTTTTFASCVLTNLVQLAQRGASPPRDIMLDATVADFPVGSTVLLINPRVDDAAQAALSAKRSMGIVRDHEDFHNAPAVTVRFAGCVVRARPSQLQLMCLPEDSLADTADMHQDGHRTNTAHVEQMETAAPSPPPKRGSRRSVAIVSPQLEEDFVAFDRTISKMPRRETGTSLTAPPEAVQEVKFTEEAAPFVPTAFKMDRLCKIHVPKGFALDVALEEVECRRLVLGLSLLMTDELASAGKLGATPPLPSKVLQPDDERFLGRLGKDPSDLTRALSQVECNRPIWRLGTECVVLGEFQLACALFALDLCVMNPDAFLLLFRFHPPTELLSGLAVLTELRHVGAEWARYYAERVAGVATEECFLHVWGASPCCPADLYVLLRDPPVPDCPADLTPAAKGVQGIATNLLNIDARGKTELSDQTLQWEDGVDAVLNRDFLHAAFVFMAARHPDYVNLPSPTIAEVNVLSSIEYGRLVARHYAIGQLRMSPAEFSAAFLSQEDRPVVFPMRMLAVPLLPASPKEGWTPRNRLLGEWAKHVLSPNEVAVQSPIKGPPALTFPAFLNTRAGVLRCGSGSALSPFIGVTYAVSQVEPGDALTLWDGVYPPVDWRGVVAPSSRVLYVVPRGYPQMAARGHARRVWGEYLSRREVLSRRDLFLISQHVIPHLAPDIAQGITALPWADVDQCHELLGMIASRLRNDGEAREEVTSSLPPATLTGHVVLGGGATPLDNDVVHLVHCRGISFLSLTIDHSCDGFGIHLAEAVQVAGCTFRRISSSPLDHLTRGVQDTAYTLNRVVQHGRLPRIVFYKIFAAAVVAVSAFGAIELAATSKENSSFIAIIWGAGLAVDLLCLQTLRVVVQAVLTFLAEERSRAPEPHPDEVLDIDMEG